MRSFIKNWSFLTVANILQQGLAFLCLVRIARLLSPEEYGSYVLILNAATIAQIIATIGLPQIVNRVVARNADSLPRVARKIFPLLLATTTITGGILILYFIFISHLTQSLLLVAGFLYVFSQSFILIADAFSFGKQQMHISSYLTSISSLLFLGFVFILPKDFFSVEFVLSGYVSIQMARALIYVVVEWRKGYFHHSVISHSVDEASLKISSLLKQSMPLFGTSLLSMPISQLPIIFLGKYSGDAQVGFYGLGNRLVMPISLVAGTMMTAMYPVFSKLFVEDKLLFDRQVERFFFVIVFFGIIMCLTFGLFSREIILTLFGEKYEYAIISFSIQIWVALNIVLHSFMGNLFLAANREKTMVKLSVFNGIVVGMAGFLGAHYGAEGLALYSWFGLLVGFSVHWYILKKNIIASISVIKEIQIFSFYITFSIVTFFFVNDILWHKLLLYVLGLVFFSVMNKKLLHSILNDARSLMNAPQVSNSSMGA